MVPVRTNAQDTSPLFWHGVTCVRQISITKYKNGVGGGGHGRLILWAESNQQGQSSSSKRHSRCGIANTLRSEVFHQLGHSRLESAQRTVVQPRHHRQKPENGVSNVDGNWTHERTDEAAERRIGLRSLYKISLLKNYHH